MQTLGFRWALGLFLILVGASMLVVPHQYRGAAYALLLPHIPAAGALFLLAGTVLLASPSFARPVLSHLAFAGGAVSALLLAATFAAAGAVTGVLVYGALTVTAALGPVAHRLPRRGDLLIYPVAAATAATGSVMLLLPAQYAARMYDPIRGALPWWGVVFLLAGCGFVVASARRLPAVVRWPTALWAAGAWGAYALVVSVPAGNVTGIAFVAALGFPAVLTALFGSPADRIDPTGLRTRLALVAMLAAMLPLVGVRAFIAEHEERAVRQQVQHDLDALAVALAHQVGDYVGLHRSAVVAISRLPDFPIAAPPRQRETLHSFAAAYPDFSALALLSAQGDFLVRTDGRSAPSVAETPLFVAARQTGEPQLHLRVSPVTGQPVVAIAAPVLAPDGSFAGVVLGTLETARLENVLRRARTTPGVQAYLVDHAGQVISHSDPSVSAFADLSLRPAVRAALLGDAVDTPDPAGSAAVPGLGWAVVVEQPEAVALADARSRRGVAFGVLVAGLLLAAGIGAIAATWLARPLAALAAAAAALAAGDSAARLPASGSSEIRFFVRTFADMRTRLVAHAAERDKIEARLRADEERFRLVTRATRDVIYDWWIADGRLTWSENVTVVFGHTLLESRIEAWEDAIHPDDRAMVAERLTEVLASGVLFAAEYRFRRSDGSYATVFDRGLLVRDQAGRPVRMVGAVADVTDRKRAEEEHTWLAAIVASSDDAIIGTTPGAIVTSWNRGAERLYGYTAEEALGRPTAILAPPDRREELSALVARVAAGQRVETYETVRLRKDGRPVDVAITFYPVVDRRGNVIGAAAIHRDIGARKQAETELHAANAELRSANAELERFAYTVSHDLKAPLVSIQGYADALAEEYQHALAGGDGERYLARIRANVSHLSRMIADVLAYSRAGRVRDEAQPVDTAALVAAVRMINLPELDACSGTLRVATPLPTVLASPAALQQVFGNLVENAIKYGGDGPAAPPTVEIGVQESTTEWRFWVRDNGPGIPPGQQDQVFQLFARMPDARRRDPNGTGVGLATVKRALDRMGGRVWIESDPDARPGTTFWFVLPKQPAPAPPTSAAPEPVAVGAGQS